MTFSYAGATSPATSLGISGIGGSSDGRAGSASDGSGGGVRNVGEGSNGGDGTPQSGSGGSAGADPTSIAGAGGTFPSGTQTAAGSGACTLPDTAQLENPEAIPTPPNCRADHSEGGVYPELPTLHPATDAAASTTMHCDGTRQLYATQPAANIMTVTWETTSGHGDFYPWLCFDALPSPLRVSAINLANCRPEVIVATSNGHLFVMRQRETETELEAWQELARPRLNSNIQDIYDFATPYQPDRLYVIDDGAVYGREKVGTDPYSAYGCWQSYGWVDAKRIAVGRQRYGVIQLFVITSTGKIKTLIDPDPSMGASAEQWTDLAAPASLVDIDASTKYDGTLAIWVLAEDGSLRAREQLSVGGWSNWKVIKPGNTPPMLTSITVRRSANNGEFKIGVDVNGDIYSDIGSAVWQRLGG